MKVVKKVVALLIILAVLCQVMLPSNVRAENSVKLYDSNSLYDEVAKNAILDNIKSKYVASDTGIDFTKGASSTNGQGVYTIASTKDDLYPVHYYRGNIDNNNVLFGGFCWQIVRTTETGGVKLIYNGSPDENGKCVNTEIDWDLQMESSNNNASYMYGFDIENINHVYNYLYLDWYKLADFFSKDIYYSGEPDISNEDFYYSEEVEYFEETGYALKNAKHHNSGDSIDGIKDKTPLYYCSFDLKSCSSVNLILWDTYNEQGFNKFYYLNLSNGFTYENIKSKNLVFANDVEYKNGRYVLKNTINIQLDKLNTEENEKKVLDGYHYFCHDFTDSCKNVNYIYNIESEFRYVIFSNGYKADDVYNEFKNSTNENDSAMKKVIDKWYSSNLVDNTEYLEDTVWCNDRSKIGDEYNKDSNIVFNDYSKKNYEDFNLSLTCPNKNDRFTINSKNGNGKLTYPVATITDIESIYAGSHPFIPYEGFSSQYSLKYQDFFFTMTPFDGSDFSYLGELFSINNFGYDLTSNFVCAVSLEYDECDNMASVRPMVSLKHSMVVSSGDGTSSNPYEVIEGNMVEYVIDGDMPDGFLPPEVGSYLKGSKVKLNSLKAGDVINGYRFLGWQTKDVEVVDGAFDMPENKVVFVGKFEKIIESPPTYDDITKYISTGVIAALGLAGAIILKKKFVKNKNI